MDSAPSVKTGAICLLDDDLSVLKSTGRLLASAGWQVQLFDNPARFLSHVRTRQPRVVVIDIWMPLMSGLEVQQRVNETSPRTRVLVLTAKDDPWVRAKALGAGASGFFLKPVRDDEFLAGVESAFSVRAR